nr:AAA family ATPase [Desulfuribacillus stibiiarsenatis]
MKKQDTLIERGMKTILDQYETGKINLAETMRFLNHDQSIQNVNLDIPNTSIQEIYQELDQLIGLAEVKSLVREIFSFLQIQNQRKLNGLLSDALVLHMIFKGNPGTGKTTVARVFGRMFKEMNILSKGHMIEVERADLVGEYIGHTAQKTREQIKKALGGILFIDEAYSLNRGGEKDFGKEAIDTLVKGMEDYKNEFILILAGYSEEIDNFLMSNPGLPSRFPININFPDYTITELMDIAELMLEERQYKFTFKARLKLRNQLERNHQLRNQNFSNARFVRNLIEKAIRKQATRLIRENQASLLSRSELMMISDLDIETTGGTSNDRILNYREKRSW